MENSDKGDREAAALRDRLSRLSEASLRINESLEFDSVLQEVVDAARALTGSRYGAISVFGEAGEVQDFIVSGMTPDEHQGLWGTPQGQRLFEYLCGLDGPLRMADMSSHVRALETPDSLPPVCVTPLLVAPIRNRGVGVGTIYLTRGDEGQEFTLEDEETVVMFASQAALVIANARRYREEQRARADVEALIETSPVGVMVFNAKTGAPVSYNREAARIVKDLHEPDRPVEELLGILTIVRADGREIPLQELSVAQALSAGETVRAEEIVIRVPDGRSVNTLMNATPIRSAKGEIESFVVTLQDMTPLEELERLRAEFLGMVSHELMTPLTSIRGSAGTLLDDESALDPAEMRQFHRIIFEQADRMRGLISDLLDVARIKTGTLSVSPGPSEVAVLVDEARTTFLSSGGRNNVRIELPPALPRVMADRRRIVQVVGNLLSNAARHSPESSIIEIIGVREGVHVAISVMDKGTGIPPDRLPHLFRKSSRIEAEDQGGDNGLGLGICKGIVEAHGGRIWAESDGPGLGARFTFTLPAAEEVANAVPEVIPTSPVRSLRAGTARPRILVVDDDPQTLRYVRDVLSKAGYAPTVTADPEEVSRLMEHEEPHLVLLDLMLPGTDGIVLMKAIHDMANVPVIFLSAYGQDQVVARAFEMGAADYVVKPFSPTELAARIQAALRRQAWPVLGAPTSPYLLGDLSIDYAQHNVTVGGRPVELTGTEFRMLAELSANAGRVLTHEQLLRQVWGHDKSGGSGPVRTIVKRLRRKLGDHADNPTYIFTKRRVGYWMAPAETLDTAPPTTS